MAAPSLIQRLRGLLPVVGLFALLLASLFMFSSATQNSEEFSRSYLMLLILVVVELLLLVALIGINLQRLIRQYRNRATGSRLTTRLVVMFVILAVVPASVLYYFSVDFIRRGIDSWFDVKVERALDDALNLSRASLDWRLEEMQRQVELMAERIDNAAPGSLDATLEASMRLSGAAEVALLDENGFAIVFSSDRPNKRAPEQLNKVILAQLRRQGSYIGLEPSLAPQEGLYARAVVAMPNSGLPAQDRLVLQALFPVPAQIGVLANRVQTAYSKYERLDYLRGPLKFSFTLTLSLVLLLSLFTAVWAAFALARRLVAPIRILAIGTRAVTSGDYNRRLPISSFANDELGFLVQSFDTMMARIAMAQDEAHHSQQIVENQKIYLETVLGHLSSGVMTFSVDGVLRTVNTQADQILGVRLEANLGVGLDQLGSEHEHLQKFVDLMKSHLAAHDEEWQEEIVLFGPEGRQVLMCRAASLPVRQSLEGGYVLVFDDITAQIQAQRDAAWGEVARRLAHEIKNPLTPIQLSAERIRHKYLPTMAAAEASVLNRATHTIVQQVEAMKKMVQAFSDYARSPRLEIMPHRLNALVTEVLELYRGENSALQINLTLDDELGSVDLDSGRIRQLLHNLIKNAIEASENTRIDVATRLHKTDELQAAELSVRDYGPGIAEALIDTLFEPYVSAKPRGSGLGLAVVKKIVEEHNGLIWVENVPDGGARFVIRMPLSVKQEHRLEQVSAQRNLFDEM